MAYEFDNDLKECQKEEEIILTAYDNGNISKEECDLLLHNLWWFDAFEMAKSIKV